MSRVYNFSAGPAVLPEEVLKEAAAEMLDYKGTGMSVMEMRHFLLFTTPSPPEGLPYPIPSSSFKKKKLDTKKNKIYVK